MYMLKGMNPRIPSAFFQPLPSYDWCQANLKDEQWLYIHQSTWSNDKTCTSLNIHLWMYRTFRILPSGWKIHQNSDSLQNSKHEKYHHNQNINIVFVMLFWGIQSLVPLVAAFHKHRAAAGRRKVITQLSKVTGSPTSGSPESQCQQEVCFTDILIRIDSQNGFSMGFRLPKKCGAMDDQHEVLLISMGKWSTIFPRSTQCWIPTVSSTNPWKCFAAICLLGS